MAAHESVSNSNCNMAAQDEVDVCESWEDMDEIGVRLFVKTDTEFTCP